MLTEIFATKVKATRNPEDSPYRVPEAQSALKKAGLRI